MNFRTIFFIILFIFFITLFKNHDGSVTNQTANTSTLKVLAGSELKDIVPMLTTIKEKTGVTIQFDYIGTLDGAEKIVTEPAQYDAAWFANIKYLSLLQADKKLIFKQEKIAISPVILGIKHSLAQKWGWLNNSNITWHDIAAKVKTGELRYAMTDPSASNTGFSTVMSLQTAFSNTGDALTSKDINEQQLTDFFRGHAMTAGSSGFLAESYLRDESNVSGLFNYESELLKLNRNPALTEKLVLIYPKDGMAIADYPLVLLTKDRADDYQKVVDYLKSAEFQDWMVKHTDRRPINPAITTESFPQAFLVDLAFPNSLDTINQILFAYLNNNRKPSHSYYVLDVSGSMAGERIAALKQTMNNLTGDDSSITGQFARFRNREIITIIPFNSTVLDSQTFNVDKNKTALLNIKTYISTLNPIGNTAIYSAMQQAYQLAEYDRLTEANRFHSIVLMTDGVNTDGMRYDDFNQYYTDHYANINTIRTFPILFGEASSDKMEKLAQLTGGKVFDSRKSPLAHVFKQIRGYQ